MLRFASVLVIVVLSWQQTTFASGLIIPDGISVFPGDSRPSVAPGQTTQPLVRASVTFARDQILRRDFIYGIDLQYSSVLDPANAGNYDQANPCEYVLATFEIRGNELVLVAKNTDLWHGTDQPLMTAGDVLKRYPVQAITGDTITVGVTQNPDFLYLTYLNQVTPVPTPIPLQEKDAWLRGASYFDTDDLLLVESSIQLSDSTILEFMESLFPASNNDPGPDYHSFTMDPAAPDRNPDPILAPYRFVPGPNTFPSGKTMAWVPHYDLSPTPRNPTGTIDWYAAPEIDSSKYELIQDAVEAYNRFFFRFQGIERKVYRFLGALPVGIHLGDPRFNVVTMPRSPPGAGFSAWSGYGIDPRNGKTIHSMITVPDSVETSGEAYWKFGQFSQLGAMNPSDFGRQMVKAVMTHETGHASGLHHNDMAGVTMRYPDRYGQSTPPLSGVSHLPIETWVAAIYYDLHTWDGPVFAWDFRALSTIYNQHRDFDPALPPLPVCGDEAAMYFGGRPNPICNTYQIGWDPTSATDLAFERIESRHLPSTVSAFEALGRVPSRVLTRAKISQLKTAEDFRTQETALFDTLKGVLAFYISTGFHSPVRMLNATLPAIDQNDATLLPGDDPGQMRARVLRDLLKGVDLVDLPLSTKQGFESAVHRALTRLKKSPYFLALTPEKQEIEVRDYQAQATAALQAFIGGDLVEAVVSEIDLMTINAAYPFFQGYNFIFKQKLSEIADDLGRPTLERAAAQRVLGGYDSGVGALAQSPWR